MSRETCAHSGCERESRTKGYCQKHYLRLWKHGTTEDVDRRRREPTVCNHADCDGTAIGRGYCLKHYTRLRRKGTTAGRDGLQGTPAADRLWIYARRGTEQECWIWTGDTDTGGYGRLYVSRDRTSVAAHRYAYELLIGPIPAGLQLDHLCRVRACVNPAHLEPVTLKENLNRGEGKSHRAARTDTCQSGRHKFSEVGVYVDARGYRRCRACSLEQRAGYRARTKASS